MCNLGMAIELTGVEKGKELSLLESIKKMMKNLKLTAQQAMDTLEIPKDDQARYASMLDDNN